MLAGGLKYEARVQSNGRRLGASLLLLAEARLIILELLHLSAADRGKASRTSSQIDQFHTIRSLRI